LELSRDAAIFCRRAKDYWLYIGVIFLGGLPVALVIFALIK
jgi:hypothetical protein